MISLFFAAVAIYLGICAVYYFAESSFLYSPRRSEWTGFAPYRKIAKTTSYESITIISEDQIALHAWWFAGQPQQPTTLFLHGNAFNISHFLPTADVLCQLGYSVLLLDYRGFGKSKGTPSEQGIYRDARAAWHYLCDTKNINPLRIVIHGRSMGGAVAAYLAQHVSAGAVIIESAYTHLPTYLAQRIRLCNIGPLLPFQWLTKAQFPTQQYLQRARCPVLVIHSIQDEVIPYRHGQQLFAVAPEPKRLLTLKGKHDSCFLTDAPTYNKQVKKFLHEHVPPL